MKPFYIIALLVATGCGQLNPPRSKVLPKTDFHSIDGEGQLRPSKKMANGTSFPSGTKFDQVLRSHIPRGHELLEDEAGSYFVRTPQGTVSSFAQEKGPTHWLFEGHIYNGSRWTIHQLRFKLETNKWTREFAIRDTLNPLSLTAFSVRVAGAISKLSFRSWELVSAVGLLSTIPPDWGGSPPRNPQEGDRFNFDEGPAVFRDGKWVLTSNAETDDVPQVNSK